MTALELTRNDDNVIDEKKTVLRACDLSPARRRIFDIVISIFRMMIASKKRIHPRGCRFRKKVGCRVLVQGPSPSFNERRTMSVILHPPTHEIEMVFGFLFSYNLLTFSRLKNANRGLGAASKRLLEPALSPPYNLRPVNQKDKDVSTINFNWERVEMLKKDNAFIYEAI